MNSWSLITRAALRDRVRWAREHLYAIMILSPLVAGMAYATAARVASYAPEGFEPSPRAGLALATLVVVAVVGLSLSRASAELYHLRRPESVHDALPVAVETHLHAALLTRAARTAVVGLVALVGRRVAGGGEALGPEVLAPLALFVSVVALAEVFAALGWIRWGHGRGAAQAAGCVTVLAPTLVLAGALLVWVVRPSLIAEGARVWLLVACVAWCVGLYALTRVLHGRWRARDIEYAKRLGTAAGRRWLMKAGLLERLGGRAVAAQLGRDLRLTRRGFSSAVYVSWTLAALWLVLFAVAAATGLLPAGAVLPPGSGEPGFLESTLLVSVVASKAACVLASVSLAGLVPVLVAHQLPHFWLERAVGARGADAWRAKLLYARAVTLPAALAAWAAGTLCGAAPASYVVPMLAECVWLWWIVSTLAGSLAFEMPEQPGLALVLMACAGLAAGGFVAFLWPMGLAIYGLGVDHLKMRGHHRAHLHLNSEGV